MIVMFVVKTPLLVEVLQTWHDLFGNVLFIHPISHFHSFYVYQEYIVFIYMVNVFSMIDSVVVFFPPDLSASLPMSNDSS